jgi:hypothetical protein
MVSSSLEHLRMPDRNRRTATQKSLSSRSSLDVAPDSHPNQRSVVKTSRFLHPLYIQVYRTGAPPERILALESEGTTWIEQPSR